MKNEEEDMYMIEVNDSNRMRFEKIMDRWKEYSTNDIMEVLLDCFDKHEKEDYPLIETEEVWLCDYHLVEAKSQGYHISSNEMLQDVIAHGIGCDVSKCDRNPINRVEINKKYWELQEEQK